MEPRMVGSAPDNSAGWAARGWALLGAYIVARELRGVCEEWEVGVVKGGSLVWVLVWLLSLGWAGLWVELVAGSVGWRRGFLE